MRSFMLGAGLVLALATSCTAREQQSAERPVAAAPSAAVREALRAFPAFATLGEGATLTRSAGRIVVSGGLPSLAIALPERADQPIHLALAERAEVSLDIADVDNDRIDGSMDRGSIAFLGAAPDVDAIVGTRGAALETLRVLRTARASSTWRMRITVGAGVADLRAREGRIEAVESSGYVPLASAPLFAIDAKGVRREVAVVVRPSSMRTYEVEAKVDTQGLTHPIAIDPLWSTLPSMANAHDQHAATRLADGRVLVTGGYQANSAIASCEIFNPATNTWSAAASMTSARAEHTATLLGDGRVFVSFGAGAGSTKPKLNTSEIYNPTTNRWTDVTTTGFTKPIARVAHTATLLGTGEIFMAGGVTGTSPESTTSRQVLYNPATNTWNIPFDAGFSSFMKNARAYHTAVLVGTKVYALGGESIDLAGTATLLDSVESWSATTGWVLSSAKLRRARCDHAAVVNDSGAIMLVGGGTRCRLGTTAPIAIGESFDPATEMVAATAPALVTARSRHTLSKLPSGLLLAAGGVGSTGAGGSFFSSAEVFDGTKWTAVEPMSGVRFRHSAHVLADGRVLVVGSGGFDVKTTEVFAPTAVGTACTSGTTCASGFCVDGVCCNSACAGNCESCAAEGSVGTCKPIAGAPVGGRPACADGGGNTCAAKRCDGASKDCVFVGSETTCAKGSCATGTALAEAKCNGAGACSTPTTKECAPYICGFEACRTDCTIDEQCVKGFTCADGACKSGASCLPDGTSKGKDGSITACAPYRCGGDGLCMGSCTATSDCVAGATCDVGSKVCVAAPTGDSGDSGGCALNSGAASSTWSLLGLFGVCALLGSRKLRAGRGR